MNFNGVLLYSTASLKAIRQTENSVLSYPNSMLKTTPPLTRYRVPAEHYL
jgi:hypothetical protein